MVLVTTDQQLPTSAGELLPGMTFTVHVVHRHFGVPVTARATVTQTEGGAVRVHARLTTATHEPLGTFTYGAAQFARLYLRG